MTKTIGTLVAYLDIMGLSAAIGQGDPVALETLKNLLAEFSCFTNYGDVFFKNPNEADIPIRFSSFSDSMIISMPVVAYEPDNSTLSFAITSVSETISIFYYLSMKAGYLMRGGMAYGDMIHEPNIVLGKALCDAVKIEQTLSIYPRIVLSHDMWQHMHPLEQDMVLSSRRIIRDADGMIIINWLEGLAYLNDQGQRGRYDPAMLTRRIDTIMATMQTQLPKQNQQKHIAYWQWMANNLQRHLPALLKTRDFFAIDPPDLVKN